MQFVPGMLVKSKKGRDKDHIYVVMDVESRFVYVADGNHRTICNMKRKNKKHLQVIKKRVCSPNADDKEVKKTCLAV